MCGIIGYTGYSQARDVLLKGLKSLEYRGYDSAGIAVFNDKIRDGQPTARSAIQIHTRINSAG